MPPGRNDPCPCGSGRKYKLCCQTADAVRGAERAATADKSRAPLPRATQHRADIRAAIQSEPEWAADAFALPIAVADGRSLRPVAVLITAGDLVVHSDTLGSLRGGAEAVADALERALLDASRAVGGWPERVVARHQDVATSLAVRLQEREVVTAVGEAPGLVAAAKSLLEHMAGTSMWPPPSSADRWRGWDLPGSLVREIFAAAADFYRAAPWEVVDNFQAPRATLPSGSAWTCRVMGAGSEEYGLVIYGDASDLFERAATRGMTESFASLAGPVISLTFERVADAPAVAVYEARSSRWPLAGPAALPRLMTINTPGGGVSEADARDLLLLLQALPAWVDAHEGPLCDEADHGTPMRAVRWTHAPTGVVLEYAGEGAGITEDMDVDVAADRAPLPPEVEAELWSIVESVRRELGPDVSDDALADEVDRRIGPAMAALNQRPQAALGGLSPTQVRALLDADWEDPDGVVQLNPEPGGDDVAAAPVVANARVLLGAGMDTGSLPATPAGNLKPALVDALLPRMSWVDEDMAAFVRGYHKRTQEGDHRELHRLRIVCEQAGLLMRRSTRFDLSADARRLARPEHAGELLARLFATWFLEFNLAYGTDYQWPELQSQVAFTIHRLREVAGEWRTAENLQDDVILPFALDALRARDDMLTAPHLALEYLVLEPLVGFGLLQRRVENARDLVNREVLFRATPLLRRLFRVHWDAAPG